MRDSKVQKPIFIIGAGRSGTTMLFDLLSNHPGLARTTGYPDGEDHEGWVKHGKCVMAGIGNSINSKYGDGINGYQYCLHLTEEDATGEIINDMHRYYSDEVLQNASDKRVLNKLPHLSNKLKYVLKIFPDAKFVHIIRDCEPMVASWVAIMDEHPSLMVYWPFEEKYPCFWLMHKPDDPVAINRLSRHPSFYPGGGGLMWADYWCKINEGIPSQMAGREDQLLTIRYEDLIAHPEVVTAKLMEFCELPKFDFKFDHFQPDTALKHRHRLSQEVRQAVIDHAVLIRRKFGYEDGVGELAWSLYIP